MENSKECRAFIKFLLSEEDVDENVKHKLQKRMENKKIEIEIEPLENEGFIILFNFSRSR